jgi:hypothetical protein
MLYPKPIKPANWETHARIIGTPEFGLINALVPLRSFLGSPIQDRTRREEAEDSADERNVCISNTRMRKVVWWEQEDLRNRGSQQNGPAVKYSKLHETVDATK